VAHSSLFTSNTDEWFTPAELFDELNAEYGPFELDVCATPENAKCSNFFTKEQDCLKQDWTVVKKCWMNPPYGHPEKPCKPQCPKQKCKKRGWHVETYIPGVIDFMRKASETAKQGTMVVALVPARTDAKWWHSYVWDRKARAPYPGVCINYLKGRRTFGGAKSSAPFPSVVVIFNPPT